MILSSASEAHGRRTKSNGAVWVAKSVGASGSRDGCFLRCSFGKRRCDWVETALSARVGWWSHSCCCKRRKRSPADSFVYLESGRRSTHGRDSGIGCDPMWMVPVHPEQMSPGFTPTSSALGRSSRRCRAGWAAPVVEKGGCAPSIAQAGCVGPDSGICVRRLHLLVGHHVKVPDRCLRTVVVRRHKW